MDVVDEAVGAARCGEHEAGDGPHQCSLCGLRHCDACVRRLDTRIFKKTGEPPPAPVLVCASCGGLVHVEGKLARPSTVHARAPAIPVQKRVLSLEAGLTAIALAVPGALALGVGSGFFHVIYWACLVAYCFQTIDHVGRGEPGLPFSSDVTDVESLCEAVVRGAVVVAVAVGPAFAGLALAPGTRVLGALLLPFGLATAPAAILSITLTRNGVNGLWPVAWVAVVQRAPRAYARLLFVFLATTLAWGGGMALASVTIARIPLFGSLAMAIVNTLFAITLAVVVGGSLRENAEAFEYD